MAQNVTPQEIDEKANSIINSIASATEDLQRDFAIAVLQHVISGCASLINVYSLKQPTNY